MTRDEAKRLSPDAMKELAQLLEAACMAARRMRRRSESVSHIRNGTTACPANVDRLQDSMFEAATELRRARNEMLDQVPPDGEDPLVVEVLRCEANGCTHQREWGGRYCGEHRTKPTRRPRHTG